METLRHIREQAGLSQPELSEISGVAQGTISDIELGKRKPRGRTLRKLAQALGVQVADLIGDSETLKVESRSSLEPSFEDALAEERLAAWEAAAEEARRLRETGRAQMWKALSGWRASKQRREPYAVRRKYLDEMGNLLEEVYDADGALGWAYLEAAVAEGGSEAKVPSYLREESRTTSHFYGELLGLVKSAKLGVRTGADAVAAKRSLEAQPEASRHRVEEAATRSASA